MAKLVAKNQLPIILRETKKILAQEGQDIRRLDWRCPVTGASLASGEMVYVTARGLGSLVKTGVAAWEAATNHALPYNLVFTQSSGALTTSSIRYGGMWCSPAGADQLLKEHGRLAGWLKAAAKLHAVRQALIKGQSGRGVNSPYTRFSLWELVAKFPSPHRLERMLWKARKRADGILACWPGERRYCSWAQLACALMSTKKIGKAGVMAAATTLGWGGHRYGAARDWLVSMRTANFPVRDASDGVIGQRATVPIWSRHGISVYHLRVEERNYFKLLWLVRHEKSGRTYHTDAWYGTEPKHAVKAALRAWPEQDRMAAQHADIVSFLKGDETGYCPLVVREHSYRAGNCSAGTESWARQHGFARRRWIPGQMLIPQLADGRVRRVAYACREALLQELQG